MKSNLLMLIAGLGAAVATQAQLPEASPEDVGVDPARLEVLHSTTRRFVEEGKHAGIITLLARDGKLVDFQAWGYRDTEKKLPMERDTICRIYSMSKIITSVGVLILLEDGRFNLDDPVANYLPELKTPRVMKGGTAAEPELEPAKGPITIKHLLTHTSGLMYDFDGDSELHKLYQQADLWNSDGLKEFTREVGKLPLKHQPGEAWTYGINTDVLGALIERVSGLTFGDFLNERLFRPLGMKDTGFDVPERARDRVAVTYKHSEENKGLVEAGQLLETWPEPGRGIQSGGAGLFSTAGDYARFAQMLLNGGELEGTRILGRKTVELMTANHLLSLPGTNHGFNPSQGFGLGVEVQLDIGRGSLPGSPGAFGWYGAATTYARIDPAENLLALAFVQHFPYNEHNFFAYWAVAYNQAVE